MQSLRAALESEAEIRKANEDLNAEVLRLGMECDEALYPTIDIVAERGSALSRATVAEAIVGRIEAEGMGDFIRYWLAKHCTENLERNALASALCAYLKGEKE
jgi:hypothetical protein